MAVRIRLARFGRTNRPVYNIVIANQRTGQRRKPIEVIGTYDPIPKPAPTSGKPFKDIKLDFARAEYWLGVGAQPSDPVARLLKKAQLLPPEWPGPNKGPVVPKRDIVEPPKTEKLPPRKVSPKDTIHHNHVE